MLKRKQFSLLLLFTVLAVSAFAVAPLAPWFRSLLDEDVSPFEIPDGHRVVRIERKIYDGSNGILVNGDLVDIVQFGAANGATIIVADAKVFCNLLHERTTATDPIMVGILLKTVDADRVVKLKATGDVYADFPNSQLPPTTQSDTGG